MGFRGAVLVLALLPAGWAHAERPADLASLAARLPSLSGTERVHALAALTDGLAEDDPQKAVVYGTEAIDLLAHAPDPALETQTLARLGWAHMLLSHYDVAQGLLDRSRRLAEGRGDQAGLARALNVQGVMARRRGDPMAAIAFFTRCLEINRALGDENEAATSLNNLGFVYSADLADYDLALKHHLEALAIRERTHDEEDVSQSLNNIGVIYGRLGEQRKALDYLERALASRRRLGINARIAGTLSNIGDVYMDEGDYARGLTHHREALELRREVGDRSTIAHSLRNVGVCETNLGRLDLAQQTLAEARRVAEEVGDQEMRARAVLAQAQLHVKRGAFGPAEVDAQQSLALAREIKNKELVRRSLRELASIQESAGRPGSALGTFKAFKDVSDEIFAEDKARRLAALEGQFLSQKREREIERLTREQALQDAEIDRQRLQLHALSGIALLLGLAGFLFYRRRTEVARMTATLSVTDPLTGLRNRRYVIQTIDADLATSRRSYALAEARAVPAENTDLVFLLVDLDHFKAVNDRYGHVAGDLVLVEVARRLRATCRDSDVVVRWGGEEFLIIGRFTTRSRAPVQAERIRRTVSEAPFDLGEGRQTSTTCSLGFAAFPFVPGHPEALSWEDVVALADEALYAAKLSGRDAWVGISAAPGGALPDGAGLRRAPSVGVREGTIAVDSSLPLERLTWRA